MSVISENQVCYFCDKPYPSCFISNYQGINVCFNCDDFKLEINFANQENGECCVCLEDKILIKLPTCIHRVCFGCCKTIYWGSTETERPIYWRELDDECPNWPYEFNHDDDNDPERIKYDEYSEYEGIYNAILTESYDENSYDELIKIRNKQFLKRPAWMNAEDFIQYENKYIRYLVNVLKAERDWEIYNEGKIRGNGLCPLCRASPSKTTA
jgi:hypothetical protein